MAVLQIKKPHELTEIDESGNIIVLPDNITENNYNITGVLQRDKIILYYGGKKKILDSVELCKLDYNFEMKVNYEHVIRKYKMPKYPLYYFLTFKQKKILATPELNYEFKKTFYDSLDNNLKLYFSGFLKTPSIFSLGLEVTENMNLILGKILNATNKLFHCNGYIMYERKKKNKPSKIKCALLMNSGIYEYKDPKSLEFDIKFTNSDYVEKLFL